MTEREYEHERRRTEQRRAEGTSGRRYGQGGRQTGGRQESRDPQRGGQTDPWSGRSSSEYSHEQPTPQFSEGQSGQQSSHQRGRQFQQTGEGTNQQTGGRMGRQPPAQTGQQADPQTGQQTGGRQMSQQTTRTNDQQSQRQAPIRPVTVRDVAVTDVVTAQPDTAITDVVRKMASENVGAVVVVHGNQPVGIVTDRKITLALGETSDVSRMQAGDLMTEDPFTVSDDTSVFELARQLGGKGVRRVPVVDDQGDLQGIVSLDDVIVLLAEEFYNLSQIIRKQSSRF